MQSKQSAGFDLPDAKKLAKLAKACRSAGISHFKCADFEFTLTPDNQPKVVKSAPKQTGPTTDPVSDDVLTSEQMLFWSTNEIPVPDANGGTS